MGKKRNCAAVVGLCLCGMWIRFRRARIHRKYEMVYNTLRVFNCKTPANRSAAAGNPEARKKFAALEYMHASIATCTYGHTRLSGGFFTGRLRNIPSVIHPLEGKTIRAAAAQRGDEWTYLPILPV